MLGASHRGRPLPGGRGELRASRMPRALVRSVAAVHVPLPRRRVLRRWLARVWTAAPRLVRVRVSGARWRAVGARRTAADAVEAGVSAHGPGLIRSTLASLPDPPRLARALH